MGTYQCLKITVALNNIFLVGNLLKIFLNAEAAVMQVNTVVSIALTPCCRHYD
jgi:hypothetical protein